MVVVTVVMVVIVGIVVVLVIIVMIVVICWDNDGIVDTELISSILIYLIITSLIINISIS